MVSTGALLDPFPMFQERVHHIQRVALAVVTVDRGTILAARRRREVLFVARRHTVGKAGHGLIRVHVRFGSGHSATCGRVRAMSALAPIADSECSAFMSARPALADFIFAKLAAACTR
jgi:hypothetical protein